jgi:hypothetical protein
MRHLFFLMAGFLTAALEQADPSACLQYSSCYTCTAASECGWANGVSCYPGTSSGASYPYSSNISWAWTSGECPATPTPLPTPTSPCLLYSTCYRCAQASGCGWANGVACYPGTSSGASYPYSSNISWAWTTGQCPVPVNGTFCGAYEGIPGISAITFSNKKLSFFRVGAGISNCRMQGSYTLRNNSVQFNPHSTTCADGTVLDVAWVTFRQAFSLTSVFEGTPLTIWLASDQCEAPFSHLPAGQYDTSTTGSTVVILAEYFLLFFGGVSGCNISGTYRTVGSSPSLLLHLPSSVCSENGNTFALLAASYTNLTNGDWFLTISYTLNGNTFAESTRPTPWSIGDATEHPGDAEAPSRPSIMESRIFNSFDLPQRNYAPLFVLAGLFVAIAILAIARYGKKPSLTRTAQLPCVPTESVGLTAVDEAE